MKNTSELFCEFKYFEMIPHEQGVTRRDPSPVIFAKGLYYVWYSKTNKSYDGYPADIWFATKSEEFLFHGDMITISDEENPEDEVNNFWSDIADKENPNEQNVGVPSEIIIRILDASSFKLSWVVEPFSGYGLTGSVAKTMGRRFIGLEKNQDRLLMAMKRIDQT